MDQNLVSLNIILSISRKPNIDYTSEVRLRGGHLVQPASTAVHLGSIPQLKLSWKDQLSKIGEKVVKSIGALLSITRSKWRGNYLAL